MASSNGTYLAVNKLSGTTTGTTAYTAKDVYYNSSVSTSQVRRIYSNSSSNIATIVWDLWNTVLSANDFNISSSGGSVETATTISSYGTDVENGNHVMDRTISPASISATTSETDKTHTVTITQTATGKKITVTGTQKGRVLSKTTYGTPTVTSTSIGTIPAGGGTVNLTVAWKQTRLYTYDNGTTSQSDVTGSSIATVLTGSGSASISNGGVYKGSLGTTAASQATVYTISSYKFSANGVSATKTGASISVQQQANTAGTTTWGSYNLSISHSPTGTLSNAGGTKTISVTCTQNGTIPYTSGSSAATTRNATATLSTTTGTLSTTSITGSGTATLTVLENIGAARTVTVTAKVSSTSKSTSFTQSAVVYIFTATVASISVAYNATSAILTGTSSRNGFYQDIQKGNVNVSGGTLGTITSSGTTFSIPITFSANGTTSAKTITVVVTQPLSGKTLTYTITQASKPVPNLISWMANTGYWIAGGSFTFGATLAYDPDIEGYTVNISVIKGTTVTKSADVTLSKTGTNGNYYTMDIQLTDKETNDGSPFYMQAVYGEETEQITLTQKESSELL